MFGFKHTRKTMPGGLYFGSPGWTPDRWDYIDPPPDPAAPPAPPQTPADLVPVLEAGGIGKTAAWLPSLRGQLLALGTSRIRTIVADFLPAQPESALPHAIAALALEDAMLGLTTIRRCVPAKSTAVVLDRHDWTLRKRWRRALRGTGIRSLPLLNCYPQADPTVLLWTLLAQRLPVGASPVTRGVLVVDSVACWALGRFLRAGNPYEHRPVQVLAAGAAPRLLLAPIGLPIDTLLQHAGLEFLNQQCIRNGMLAGQEITPADEVVEEDTEIIAVRPFPAAENPTPCIECGWCVDHCPTALNPAKLYHLSPAAAATPDGREARHCIDCGLCSYVCPTRLPLTQRIVELRTALRHPVAAAVHK